MRSKAAKIINKIAGLTNEKSRDLKREFVKTPRPQRHHAISDFKKIIESQKV